MLLLETIIDFYIISLADEFSLGSMSIQVQFNT